MVTFFRRTGWPHLGIQRSDHEMRGVRRRHIKIASQCLVRQYVMPERPRVLRAEPMAIVITIPPKLRWPALRLQLARIRSETKIPTAHGNGRIGFGDMEFRVRCMATVMPTSGTIDPVIQPPAQTVGSQLLISLTQSRQ